jgi:hypothetical protein
VSSQSSAAAGARPKRLDTVGDRYKAWDVRRCNRLCDERQGFSVLISPSGGLAAGRSGNFEPALPAARPVSPSPPASAAPRSDVIDRACVAAAVSKAFQQAMDRVGEIGLYGYSTGGQVSAILSSCAKRAGGGPMAFPRWFVGTDGGSAVPACSQICLRGHREGKRQAASGWRRTPRRRRKKTVAKKRKSTGGSQRTEPLACGRPGLPPCPK